MNPAPSVLEVTEVMWQLFPPFVSLRHRSTFTKMLQTLKLHGQIPDTRNKAGTWGTSRSGCSNTERSTNEPLNTRPCCRCAGCFSLVFSTLIHLKTATRKPQLKPNKNGIQSSVHSNASGFPIFSCIHRLLKLK